MATLYVNGDKIYIDYDGESYYEDRIWQLEIKSIDKLYIKIEKDYKLTAKKYANFKDKIHVFLAKITFLIIDGLSDSGKNVIFENNVFDNIKNIQISSSDYVRNLQLNLPKVEWASLMETNPETLVKFKNIEKIQIYIIKATKDFSPYIKLVNQLSVKNLIFLISHRSMISKLFSIYWIQFDTVEFYVIGFAKEFKYSSHLNLIDTLQTDIADIFLNSMETSDSSKYFKDISQLSFRIENIPNLWDTHKKSFDGFFQHFLKTKLEKLCYSNAGNKICIATNDKKKIITLTVDTVNELFTPKNNIIRHIYGLYEKVHIDVPELVIETVDKKGLPVEPSVEDKLLDKLSNIIAADTLEPLKRITFKFKPPRDAFSTDVYNNITRWKVTKNFEMKKTSEAHGSGCGSKIKNLFKKSKKGNGKIISLLFEKE